MTFLLCSFSSGTAMPLPEQMHQGTGQNQQVGRGGRPCIVAVIPEQIINGRRNREHGSKPKPRT
jgi:hypothetical protein